MNTVDANFCVFLQSKTALAAERTPFLKDVYRFGTAALEDWTWLVRLFKTAPPQEPPKESALDKLKIEWLTSVWECGKKGFFTVPKPGTAPLALPSAQAGAAQARRPAAAEDDATHHRYDDFTCF